MSDYRLTYLSFGGGVQSTALLIMSALGLHGCPRADYAVFADTGDEPAWVYESVDRMRTWAARFGIPVDVVTRGSLSEDLIAGAIEKPQWFAAIPAFVRGDDGRSAMLMRQCTKEYKVVPIMREARRRLMVGPRDRLKPGTARALVGISLDEAQRMKPAWWKWIDNTYPLVDAGLRRADCERLIAGYGLPVPRKSACVYCPFHSDVSWLDLKTNHPEEFEKAAAFDERIRNMTKSGITRPVFLHRSLIPLRDVTFDKAQRPLFADQFGNECEGVCGV